MKENKQEIIEENKNSEVEETPNVETADSQDTKDAVEDNAKETIQEVASEETNSRYKVLDNLECNLWTYGSPVVFQKGTLKKDTTTDRNLLTFEFVNIYTDNIKNVYITVFASGNEDETEQIEHKYLALNQKPLETKGESTRVYIGNDKLDKFKIRLDGVTFENGTKWVKEQSMLEGAGEVEDIAVFAETKLKDYEDIYTSGNEEIAKDDSASIGNGIEILNRITWYRNVRELLKHANKKYNLAKKNEERRQESESRKEQRQKAVKKRYKVIGGIVIGVVVVAVIATVAFIIPNNKYQQAKKYIKSQNYNKAITAFSDLHGFMDSEGYLAQAYYNLGTKELAKNDENKASDYFKKSHDASANSDYGKMAGAYLDYYAGTEALNKKEYDNALKYFTSSAGAASDFNLINKASAAMAQVSYIQNQYESAWKAIKNVFAKDTSYSAQYGEYGYGYAKSLVDAGKISEGMTIYNLVSKYTQAANLNDSVYSQAVKLGEQGKISESMNLLNQIKKNYSKANTLYEKMYKFNHKVRFWLGLWKHHGVVNGEKKTYRIRISAILYKGDMCLKIQDKNNKTLGFETVISSKNHVTQITIGTYQLHFKLKKFHDQKFTYVLKGGKKMVRELKYDGHKYSTKYKKKVK